MWPGLAHSKPFEFSESSQTLFRVSGLLPCLLHVHITANIGLLHVFSNTSSSLGVVVSNAKQLVASNNLPANAVELAESSATTFRLASEIKSTPDKTITRNFILKLPLVAENRSVTHQIIKVLLHILNIGCLKT